MARRVGRRTGSAGGRGVGAACAHTRRESEAHLLLVTPLARLQSPSNPPGRHLLGLDRQQEGRKGRAVGASPAHGGAHAGGAHCRGPTRGASRETPPPERTRPSRGSRLAAGRLALPLRSPAANQPPGLSAARGTPRAGKWSPRYQKKEQKKPTWLAKGAMETARGARSPSLHLSSPPALSRPPSRLNIP
jgi:hypothetical protein